MNLVNFTLGDGCKVTPLRRRTHDELRVASIETRHASGCAETVNFMNFTFRSVTNRGDPPRANTVNFVNFNPCATALPCAPLDFPRPDRLRVAPIRFSWNRE